MNLWPVEHFFEHICHHFWVGATGATANPPKSDDEYAQKSVLLVKGSSFRNDLLQNPYFNLQHFLGCKKCFCIGMITNGMSGKKS